MNSMRVPQRLNRSRVAEKKNIDITYTSLGLVIQHLACRSDPALSYSSRSFRMSV